MAEPRTRRDECEAYPQWAARNEIDPTRWDRVLDALYDGKEAVTVHRDLGLAERCLRSLQLHRQSHLGYILFRYGARIKDRRLQMAGTLSTAYQQLIEKVLALAIDEAVKPAHRLRATELVQRELADLTKLAAETVKEFEAAESENDRAQVGDIQDLVRRIAADVYGIQRDDGDG